MFLLPYMLKQVFQQQQQKNIEYRSRNSCIRTFRFVGTVAIVLEDK